MTPISKIISLASIVYGLFASSFVSANKKDMEDAIDKVSQRRRDLQEQGTMSKKEAEFVRKLMAKNVLRLADKPEDLQARREALTANNPFAKALGRNDASQEKKPPNGRRSRGARRAQEHGEASAPRELSGTQRKGSKKNNSNKSGDTDDYYHGPAVPELIPMVLEAFQDSRLAQPPVLTAPLSEETAAGTQYVYANEPLYNVQLDSPGSHVASGTQGYFVDESDLIATVSGTCTRTDPNTGNELYVGRAYCELSYHFLDEFGNVEAGLVAEGPLQIGDYSTLSITGGSGIFRGTVGTVILESGSIDFGSSPVFAPDPLLDLPSSYIVNMFVFMDALSVQGHHF